MLNVNNGIGLFRRIVKSLAGGVSEHERLSRACIQSRPVLGTTIFLDRPMSLFTALEYALMRWGGGCVSNYYKKEVEL